MYGAITQETGLHPHTAAHGTKPLISQVLHNTGGLNSEALTHQDFENTQTEISAFYAGCQNP